MRWGGKRDYQRTAGVGLLKCGVVETGVRFTGNCIWGVGKRGEIYVYSLFLGPVCLRRLSVWRK